MPGHLGRSNLFGRLIEPHPKIISGDDRLGARLFGSLMLIHILLIAALLPLVNFAWWSNAGDTIWQDKDTKAVLGARPRIRRGRVPSAAGADARRRDAGDVAAHRRGAPTPQMPPRRRNPKGAWGLRGDLRVARRQRCAETSPPPRALSSPRKPHARDPS